MSSGLGKEQEEKRVLRRSTRTTRGVVPAIVVDKDSSESEGSETGTVVEWTIGDEIVDIGGSDIAQFGSESSEESTVERGERMNNRDTESKDLGLGQGMGAGLGEVMKLFFEEQRKEREERRADREQRERAEMARREYERQERETEARNNRLLMESVVNSRPQVPDPTPPARSIVLPRMGEGDEIETFITGFETALKLGEVPRGLWKRELATHIPMTTLAKVNDTVNEDGSTYEDVIGALRGSTSLSFGSAAEDLCTGEQGRVYEMDIRPSLSRLKHLLKAVAGDVYSIDEMAEAIAVALARDHLVPALKTVIDTGMRFKYKEFIDSCEQWEKSQPRGTLCYRKPRANLPFPARSMGSS